MHNPFRAVAGQSTSPPIVSDVAASHAPVTEPQPQTQPQNLRTPVRPISPAEAERIARQATVERARRQSTGERQPLLIPSLPPAPRPPARLTPVLLVLSEMLLDVLAIAAAFGFAYWLRFESDIKLKFVEPDTATYTMMLGVTMATQLVTFYFSRLYNLKRGASRVDEFYKIAAAVSMGTVLSLATNSLILGDKFIYSRQILLTGWLLAIVLVTVVRVLYGYLVGQLRRVGLDRSRVLIIGTGSTAAVVVDRLDRHQSLGYQVIGLVDNDPESPTPKRAVVESQVPVLGDVARLSEVIRTHNVDEVIVALQGASDKELRKIMILLQDESVSVKIYPDAFQLMTQNEVSVGELGGLPLLSVKDVALRGWNRRLKRAFDVVFSLLVLTLTAPLMLIIAAAVKLTSPGPVFFIQERVGLDGMPFQLVKFRTMRIESDERETPDWTVPNDPRRTRLGAFLRRFSLDELPQFYNVLVGEMSVVGPRPEQPQYVQEFAQRMGPEVYLRRHREKAGITGWAQVNELRGDSSIERRTLADLYYVENWSLLFDLKIIVRTVLAMFKGKNAY
jgi:Undecaprenyl-phosphate glucose phosphotransferase